MNWELLQEYFDAVQMTPGWRWRGHVIEANGQTIESDGPPCSVGECCEIVSGDGVRHSAEVIGFRGRRVIAMPLIATRGLRHGDSVFSSGRGAEIAIGEAMRGRVLDAMGMPIDERGPMLGTEMWPRRWTGCRFARR